MRRVISTRLDISLSGLVSPSLLEAILFELLPFSKILFRNVDTWECLPKAQLILLAETWTLKKILLIVAGF